MWPSWGEGHDPQAENWFKDKKTWRAPLSPFWSPWVPLNFHHPCLENTDYGELKFDLHLFKYHSVIWGPVFFLGGMTFTECEGSCDIQIYISGLSDLVGFVLRWLFSKGHVSFCRFVEMAFLLPFTVLELDSDWQFVPWSKVQIRNALFPVCLCPILNSFSISYHPFQSDHFGFGQWTT